MAGYVSRCWIAWTRSWSAWSGQMRAVNYYWSFNFIRSTNQKRKTTRKPPIIFNIHKLHSNRIGHSCVLYFIVANCANSMWLSEIIIVSVNTKVLLNDQMIWQIGAFNWWNKQKKKKIIEKVQYVRNEQILEMKENRLITVNKLT